MATIKLVVWNTASSNKMEISNPLTSLKTLTIDADWQNGVVAIALYKIFAANTKSTFKSESNSKISII